MLEQSRASAQRTQPRLDQLHVHKGAAPSCSKDGTIAITASWENPIAKAPHLTGAVIGEPEFASCHIVQKHLPSLNRVTNVRQKWLAKQAYRS